MDVSETVGRISSIAKVIGESGDHESAEALSYAVQKLFSADYCVTNISDDHLGGPGDRTYTEATPFFCKAALDIAVEALNRRFKLGLSREGMAASTQDLQRSILKGTSKLNKAG